MTQPIRNPFQETIIYLKPSTTSPTEALKVWDRVQSVSVRGDYPIEDIRELGNRSIVDVSKDIPTFTVDVEAYDVSTDTIALLQGTADPHAAAGGAQYSINYDQFVASTITIMNRTIGASSVVYSDEFDNCTLTAINMSYSVDGLGMEKYTFTTDSRTTDDTVATTFDESTIHENPTTHVGAVRGKNIDIFVNGVSLTRVQDVSIDVSFPNRYIKEMGNTSYVATVTDIPDVTGSFTVLATDVDNLYGTAATPIISTETGGVHTQDTWVDTALDIEIILYDPADNVTALKTIIIPSIEISGEGIECRVGEDVGRTFDFRISGGSTMSIYKGDN